MSEIKTLKDQWCNDYKFFAGSQWGDAPPTDEEVEAAWRRMQPRLAALFDDHLKPVVKTNKDSSHSPDLRE